MKIFIHKDGQPHGPFSLDEVNSKALTGELSSSDPAWIQGWAEWQPLSCLSGFVPRPVPPPFKPQVSPPPIVPSIPTDQKMRVGPIIRDVVIVWVLTAIGGFVAGIATGGPQRDAQRFMLALIVSNFLLGTVAFTIAGCLAPPARWRHLGFVALGAWLTSLINVVFFGVSIPQWIGGAIFMAIIMGIGGAISYVFNKDEGPRQSAAKTAQPRRYWENVSVGSEDRGSRNFFTREQKPLGSVTRPAVPPFEPQVSPPLIPPSQSQLPQVERISKVNSALPAARHGSAATVGPYVFGLLLLVIGFFSQEGADAYHISREISVQAAAIIGGACPALLVLVGLSGWYWWFRRHRGSVIMLVGLLAAAKGLGALTARLLIVSYLTQASAKAVPAIIPRPAPPRPSPTAETEDFQEFQRQRAQSKAEAIALYPDVADHKTPLGKEVDRLIESYKATDDPILYASDAPMLITLAAARNLGVASATGKKITP